ncbi:MAG: 2-oxoglutarate dehydrogenase complex dihydrolipoyllysine-residue succinyltransferase [Candidatus Promineofilum sp.]|nr:2-oxoglutarate dehydrogenase complex dihydrolipoyllysine-residue succinyltransferase [Promineifilum sp.]
MSTEIVVPELGESVVEATVGEWRVAEGQAVKVGDVVVELETDKVDVEVGATAAGVLTRILHPAGSDVRIGDVLGLIDGDGTEVQGSRGAGEQGSNASVAPANSRPPTAPEDAGSTPATRPSPLATPLARRMAEAEGIDLANVAGSGAGGRVTKQDVAARVAQPSASEDADSALSPGGRGSTDPLPSPLPQGEGAGAIPPAPLPPRAPALPSTRPEERQRMSRRRRTIAQRLVEAQHTAAMLTTFNEVDMSAVMDLRRRRQEAFTAANGVKLGLTSFFVKAAIGALRAFPRLNAEIQGDEIVLKGYYDIGIAVGAEEGLVVPVIRDADRLSFAAIERQVRDFGAKAKDNSFTLEELRGGTFTITNGGVFGSMLSTPILNPPQVGILGLHNIQDRPVVRDGQIVIRPMMYVALSYDHRIVDGREAVQFLVRVKQLVEEPEALLLEG